MKKTKDAAAPPPTRRTRFAWALETEGVQQLAEMTGAIGQPGFYRILVTLLRGLIDSDIGVAMVYSLDQVPRYVEVQAEAARRRGAREAVYTEGPYVLDPVYQLFLRGQADGAYAMSEYVPDNFQHTEFYECFFRRTHLVDTIDVLWRIDARSAVTVCLGREEGTPPFGVAELALVRHVLPVVFSALRRHHQIVAPATPDEADRLVHRKVESTMANFGASLLTKREREVLFYMLSGYSSEQTALRLQTAEGTIRNQRKSIHRKLDISSQAELFSIFIQCVPFANPDEPVDPLLKFEGRRSGKA